MTATTDDRRGGAPPDPGRRSPEERAAGTMTLFEHLVELRNRLIICLVAVIAGMVVAWFFYDSAIQFMVHPYQQYLAHHHSKDITNGELVTSGPLEGFTTRLKVCGYGGLVLGAPVIIWELWRFITPGLYKHEKRYVVPFVAAGIILFALGVTTSILIFPKAIDWLINVSGTGIAPLFSPSKYFTMYVAMCVVFGAVFMYPLVLVFLMLVGVVPTTRWRKWRRPAIVVIAVVAAVITPSSDPFSFLAMAIPMTVLYELSIVVGRLLKK